jgi:pyridoxamine 5'-phosphate oxidase-like protein
MGTQPDLAAIVRAIVDDNRYMTLGTVDERGRPWVSPVFFAAAGYTDFYWISSPEADHSGNLARRPEVSIVVFDSRVPPGSGQAVYLSATAVELAGDEVERGLEVYPGPAERGARPMTADQLRPPAAYRLYRATASRHWILCPRDPGQPCRPHGRAFDHRIAVAIAP